MKKSEYVLKSFVNALGVFVYVFIVAWLGFNSQAIFGMPATFLVPLFALLLFVVSASITGLLVFGRPVLLYLGGFKKEAFVFLFATLAWLGIFLLGTAVVLLLL